MSRKSARLQSRSKQLEPETVTRPIICRKRKAMEDDDLEIEVAKRRQQFKIQNQWIPISEDSSVTSCSIIPNKPSCTVTEKQQTSTTEFPIGAKFRFQNFFTNVTSRLSPLPRFSWADSKEVWQLMLKKEVMYVRDSSMFVRHPALQARMRAILLDWLTEVCEVYRLHRESFFLAIDFIDRYLSKKSNVLKHHLQLIGISALFIAAKLEEIYPPKLQDFAYVTDGACTEEEILDQELIMLKVLNWDLAPMTVNAWLSVYLQVANMEQMTESEHGFVFPQFSAHSFIQITRLLDVCMYDIGCLKFSYSVLAASALYHMSSKDIALAVSGFFWQDILPCVQWMSPFAITIRETGPIEVKFFPTVPSEDSHNIQTHCVDLQLLEKAQNRQEEVMNASRRSPDITAQVITMLTPPCSDEKPSQTQHFHIEDEIA
ncbi:G1/S-specific cyclin-E-like isoform X2 [Gigantopelta aegis]|nr:G1/S-specific cyclin-E-like isoform X2 [Gigantopelta aegis]XP_041375901.1 G1/S-specific cyclin-E-like isoform X2 [Gigantopelta aegis]